MLSVKIEFCPLDWYSSTLTAIVLYKRMYMCKMFPSNRQNLKKRKCDLHDINSVLPRAFQRGKRRNSLRHAKPIPNKIHLTSCTKIEISRSACENQQQFTSFLKNVYFTVNLVLGHLKIVPFDSAF